MNNSQTQQSDGTPEQEEAMLEVARNEAQARVAALHAEEGTVQSEGAQNSPHPDDHD